MNMGKNQPDNPFQDFEDSAKEIRKRLKPDGPPVDFAAIHLYIAGDLDEHESRCVSERIVTWQSWYRAYWETMLLLAPEKAASQDRDSTSERPVNETIGIRTSPAAAKRWLASSPIASRLFGVGRTGLRRRLVVATAATILVALGLVLWSSNRHGPRLALELKDGKEVVGLDTDGNLVGFDSLPEEWRNRAKHALTTREVTLSEQVAILSTTRGPSIDDPSSLLISPVGVVVETDRPTFRWKAIEGAADYSVTVYDATLKDIVVSSEPVHSTEWTVREALARGTVFAWKLTIVKDGEKFFAPRLPKRPPAFEILGSERFEELQRAKEVCGERHLVLGIAYAQAGLEDEARQQFRSLYDANPHSAVAAKLLRSVERPVRPSP